MTYAQFHLIFTIPVVLLLAAVQRRPVAGIGAAPALRWLAALCGIAFVYTTPWDNYLVFRNVWGYPPGRVLATVGHVPVEEYFFFLIQPVMVGLLYFWLRGRGAFESPLARIPRGFRAGLAAYWLFWSALGVVCLFLPTERTLYLGLILAWACPVLAGLSWIGAGKIWDDRRRVLVAISGMSLYLWIADRTAIDLGIWWISETYSLGMAPLGLPVEEAAFFVVTSALCASALALFLPRSTRIH